MSSFRSHLAHRTARMGLAIVALLALTAVQQVPAHATSKASASLPTVHWPGLQSYTQLPALDPDQAIETGAYSFIATIHASLVKRLPSGKIVPYIASRWTVSKNHKVYTFYLRSDVRFSNGDPLTSKDVVFSVKRLLAPSTSSPNASSVTILGAADYTAGKSTKLPGVVAVSKYVVRLTSSAPTTSFLSGFSQQGIGLVLDHKALAGKTAAAKGNYMNGTCSGNVGAGPFRLVCRNKSSDVSSFYTSGATPSLTIEPNPYFFGHHPQYRMVWRVIKDSQTAYLEYKSGQQDASEIPSTFIAENLGKKGVFHFNTFLVWYLSPAYDVAPFDNIHCRLAVAYAIDSAKIDKTVLHGSWAPLHSLMPKGVPGYYPGKDNPSYNPTKAKAELAQCPGGIHNQSIVYETYNSDMEDSFAGAIPAMLGAVGIEAKGNGIPTAPWLKVVTATQKSTNNPLIQGGLTGPDPNTWCNLRKSGFVLNTANFNSAQFDSLCAKGAATFDSARAAKIYQQASHIALSQGTYIPIGQVQQFAVSKFPGVVGDPSWTQLAPKNFDWANITVK